MSCRKQDASRDAERDVNHVVADATAVWIAAEIAPDDAEAVF